MTYYMKGIDMTLQDWSKMTGVLPTHPTTEKGAVSVIVDNPPSELWHLSDYVVSSVSGPVVWLLKRGEFKDYV
jgi:hypothetical protein